MGSACSAPDRGGTITEKGSNIPPIVSVADIVVGQIADDMYHEGDSAPLLHIRDIVVRRTDNANGAIYTIRHGKKVQCVKVTMLASSAILAELRACFMDNTALTTTFFVTNASGFNVGHFNLFRDIHPTDLIAENILTSLLGNLGR